MRVGFVVPANGRAYYKTRCKTVSSTDIKNLYAKAAKVVFCIGLWCDVSSSLVVWYFRYMTLYNDNLHGYEYIGNARMKLDVGRDVMIR